MKFSLPLFLAVLIGLCLPAHSQTNGLALGPTTNNPTIQGGLNQIIQAVESGNTNWYFAGFGLHAPSLRKKWGGGIGAFYPISTYVVTGVRLDYVDGDFWMPSGNVTLQLPITPIKSWSWFTLTPIGYGGV